MVEGWLVFGSYLGSYKMGSGLWVLRLILEGCSIGANWRFLVSL